MATSAESQLTDAKGTPVGGDLQFSTMTVAGRQYGIDVTMVQEIVRPMPMTKIPLAPPYIYGLINLRGQVVTAIGLMELFGIPGKPPEGLMNVICKHEDNLISLLVEEIGDVVEVNSSSFEPTPNTISPDLKKFLSGIYKFNDSLLSIIDISAIMEVLDS